MLRIVVVLTGFAVAMFAAFWAVTIPGRVQGADLPAHAPDLANGELIFIIGGCPSCHAEKEAVGGARLELGGGRRLATPFGTFVAPNISPDRETGIGGWDDADFVTAMTLGVSPRGEHLYPAFPYASYARMRTQDLIDLKAYLDTLPPVRRANEPHDLIWPFSIRRGLGLWKLIYLDPAPVVALRDADPQTARGRYLVEGPGHCGECHTPRTMIGGPDLTRWLAGGPSPEGKGSIPNITPSPDGIGSWSAVDIAYALETGFTPDFDSLGGPMSEVIRNTSALPAAEREAIAAYLRAIPPLRSATPATPAPSG